MGKKNLELVVPSEFQNEKYAIALVEDIAMEMGFPADKGENIKIAVGEACLNAIEHGNMQNHNLAVKIDFVLRESYLEIFIRDQGKKFIPKTIEKPSLKDKIEGKDKSNRG